MKFIRVLVALLLALLLSTSMLTASAASYEVEKEPNNTLKEANTIGFEKKVHGSIGNLKDHDYFKFEIEESRQVEFSIKQWGYRTSIEIQREGTAGTIYKKKISGKLGSRTEKLKVKKNLIPGTYYIKLYTAKNKQYGRYELGIANLKAATPGISMPATKRVTKGYTTIIEATAKPSYFPKPEGVTYKSSSKAIATVDKDTGVVTGIKKGSCYITATAADGKKAKCKVTVIGNTFLRAKPLTSTKKNLYISTRRMTYTNDALIIYMFVHNKTGKVFESTLDMKMDLVEKSTGNVLYSAAEIKGWPNKGVIFNNQNKLVKFVVPKSEIGKINVGGKLYVPKVTVTNGKTYEQLGNP